MDDAILAKEFDDGIIAITCNAVGDSFGVLNAADADCCCDTDLCASLPDRIRIRLGGVYRVSESITVENPTTGDTNTQNQEIEISIPTTFLTMDKQEDSDGVPFYSVPVVSCELPVYGNGSQRFTTLSAGFDTVYKRIVGVRVNPRGEPLFNDQGELTGYNCLLGRIRVLFEVDQYSVFSPNPTEPFPTVVAAEGVYESLSTPIVGSHFVFGRSRLADSDGRFTRTVAADGEGNGTFATAREPASYSDTDPFTGVITSISTSFTSWRATIEAWDEDAVCDGSGIVYAVKCDGTGARITVDLDDRLETGQSSPLYQGELYRPTEDRSTEPVTTRAWVDQVCGEAVLHAVYEKCDDGTTILVDDSNKPADAVTALVNNDPSLRYFPSGERAEGEPIDVDWSTDPCPTGGDLFQACPGSPTLQYYRIPGAGTAPVVRISALGPQYPDGNRFCRDQYLVSYERVTDDGREAPSHGFISTALQCEGPTLLKLKAVCSFRPIDPDDGPQIEPDSPAGQSPPTPINPLVQAQMRHFNNPNCPSCGG